MGKIISNGVEYGGSSVINEINGVFIDTDNIIVPLTEYKSSMTYTATEDCYVILYTVFGSNTTIRINSEIVGNFDGRGNLGITNNFYLKNGQTISVANASSSYNSYYIIYGIQQGSQDTTKNEIYSTEERAVGTWIDGSTLYEKTIEFGYLPNNTTKIVSHGIANIDIIFATEAFMINPTTGNSTYLNMTNDTISSQVEYVVNRTDIEVWAGLDRSKWMGYITIRYTKSTT